MTGGDDANTLGFTHRFEPGTGSDAPLVLALHGTGGGEDDLLPLARHLAPDAPVLAPRGQVIEADGIPRFFRRFPAAPGAGASAAYPFTFDDADVAARAAELAAFAEVARSRYGVGDRPLVAVGFSNGANIAGALLLLRPGLLRAAVLFAPMPVLDDPPRVDLRDTAVFCGTGRDDPIAPPANVERLAAMLSDAGAAVEVHVGAGGHEVRPSVVHAAADWFTKLRATLALDPGGLP